MTVNPACALHLHLQGLFVLMMSSIGVHVQIDVYSYTSGVRLTWTRVRQRLRTHTQTWLEIIRQQYRHRSQAPTQALGLNDQIEGQQLEFMLK